MKRNLFLTLITVLPLFLLSQGCTNIKNYYAIPNGPTVGYADLQKNVGIKPSLDVSFEFQRDGVPLPAVSQKYFPTIIQVMKQSDLFSSVTYGMGDSEARVEIVLNNIVDSYVGAVTQGVASGLTLGLVGTHVTDDYVFTGKYIKTGGHAISTKSNAALLSTSGLIHEGLESVKPNDTLKGAFDEMLENLILSWLKDLQQQEAL